MTLASSVLQPSIAVIWRAVLVVKVGTAVELAKARALRVSDL
jgi:hypothetical protein